MIVQQFLFKSNILTQTCELYGGYNLNSYTKEQFTDVRVLNTISAIFNIMIKLTDGIFHSICYIEMKQN